MFVCGVTRLHSYMCNVYTFRCVYNRRVVPCRVCMIHNGPSLRTVCQTMSLVYKYVSTLWHRHTIPRTIYSYIARAHRVTHIPTSIQHGLVMYIVMCTPLRWCTIVWTSGCIITRELGYAKFCGGYGAVVRVSVFALACVCSEFMCFAHVVDMRLSYQCTCIVLYPCVAFGVTGLHMYRDMMAPGYGDTLEACVPNRCIQACHHRLLQLYAYRVRPTQFRTRRLLNACLHIR